MSAVLFRTPEQRGVGRPLLRKFVHKFTLRNQALLDQEFPEGVDWAKADTKNSSNLTVPCLSTCANLFLLFRQRGSHCRGQSSGTGAFSTISLVSPQARQEVEARPLWISSMRSRYASADSRSGWTDLFRCRARRWRSIPVSSQRPGSSCRGGSESPRASWGGPALLCTTANLATTSARAAPYTSRANNMQADD